MLHPFRGSRLPELAHEVGQEDQPNLTCSAAAIGHADAGASTLGSWQRGGAERMGHGHADFLARCSVPGEATTWPEHRSACRGHRFCHVTCSHAFCVRRLRERAARDWLQPVKESAESVSARCALLA